MKAAFSPSAPRTVGVRVDDFVLAVSPQNDIVSSAGTAPAAIKDRLVSRTSGTVYDQVFTAVGQAPIGESVVTTNLTPGVATLDANGKATRVSDGVSRLLVTSTRGPAFLRREFQQQVQRVTGAVVDTPLPQSGAVGSLRRHLWDTLLAALAGKTPGPATQNLYSAHTIGLTPSATLNPGLWLPGMDFTHSSYQKAFDYNGTPILTEQGQCHLISPRHAIASQHISEYSFPMVVFRRPDGSFQTVGSMGWRKFGNDSVVHYLSAPVTGIAPVKFVPLSYHDKLPDYWMDNNGTGAPLFQIKPQYPIPCVSLYIREGSSGSDTPFATEERRLRFRLSNAVYGETFGLFRRLMYQTPYPYPAEYANLQPWMARAESGDSSSMTYLVINGELCAFGLQWGYDNGPCLPECLDTLTLEMNSLAASFGDNTVYAPQVADLSMFTSY